MGSLSPSATPTPAPAPVFVPQATAVAPVVAEVAAPTEQELQQQSAQEREDNLLRRSRGRAGTIQTSFRGLLGQSAPEGQQKTLLGE